MSRPVSGTNKTTGKPTGQHSTPATAGPQRQTKTASKTGTAKTGGNSTSKYSSSKWARGKDGCKIKCEGSI